MSLSPARTSAFDILVRIERERAFSSVLLPIYEERLSPADRGLCHELVLGTLRQRLSLDRQIDHLSRGRKLDLEVRIALRLGLLQLTQLDRVPPRAAINESVDLVKRAKKTSASGFVNALLRRVTRESIELVYKDDFDRISVETSHPLWLIERWAGKHGITEAEALARANNTPAPVAFRAIAELDADLTELLRSSTPSASVSGCYLLDRSTQLVRKLASENKIYLQDEASQMVAHAVKVPSGGTFLDVCAAPGGKTGLIVSTNAPGSAVAGDLHQARVQLLASNCRRQGVEVKIVRHNAVEAVPFADYTFDAVLVDAPCSGTGTIRHNPEIRYSVEPGDLEELSSKQRRILRNASKCVSKGGLLVYSTCSLEREEGEDVVEAFLESDDAFQPVPPKVPDGYLDRSGSARTWPHRDDMDGFLIAAFQRR